MTNIIQCLKFLHVPRTGQELVNELKMPRLLVLELIGKINSLEPDLINANELNNIHLTRTIDWLDTDRLQNLFIKNNLEYIFVIFDEVESTNSALLTNIDAFLPKFILTTEYQSGGRGRGDKKWVSAIATDLTVSIVYWFDLDFKFEV